MYVHIVYILTRCDLLGCHNTNLVHRCEVIVLYICAICLLMHICCVVVCGCYRYCTPRIRDTTTTVLRPILRDCAGKPVPEMLGHINSSASSLSCSVPLIGLFRSLRTNTSSLFNFKLFKSLQQPLSMFFFVNLWG